MSTNKLPIEHGVPLPHDWRRRHADLLAACPFGAMRPGDSFFVPLGELWGIEPRSVMARVGYARKMWCSDHPGQRFSARKVTENGVRGVRCWRVL